MKHDPFRPVEGRYNIYFGVHKGLRLGHARMMTRLSSTDWADPADGRAALSALRGFLALAGCHLHSEETHIHPAIEARAPGGSAHAHEGHEDHDVAFSHLKQLCTDIERAYDAGHRDARGLGRALYSRYIAFVAADLEHMAVEETELLGTLQHLYSDDELHGIEGRLVSQVPPDLMGGFLALMVPAASRPERAEMLSGMRQAMPQDAFDGVMREVIRPALGPVEAEALDAALAA